MDGLERIRIKRAYDGRSPDDGRRVLVDRLWPRGVSKAELGDAVWMKDLAPSAGLRKWFGHKPERWEAFRSRYIRELQSNPTLEALRELAASGPVTLVYGARDEAHNQAVVLAELLRGLGGECAMDQPEDLPPAKPAGPVDLDQRERALDQALDQSFPASDPPSMLRPHPRAVADGTTPR